MKFIYSKCSNSQCNLITIKNSIKYKEVLHAIIFKYLGCIYHIYFFNFTDNTT